MGAVIWLVSEHLNRWISPSTHMPATLTACQCQYHTKQLMRKSTKCDQLWECIVHVLHVSLYTAITQVTTHDRDSHNIPGRRHRHHCQLPALHEPVSSQTHTSMKHSLSFSYHQQSYTCMITTLWFCTITMVGHSSVYILYHTIWIVETHQLYIYNIQLTTDWWLGHFQHSR